MTQDHVLLYMYFRLFNFTFTLYLSLLGSLISPGVYKRHSKYFSFNLCLYLF